MGGIYWAGTKSEVVQDTIKGEANPLYAREILKHKVVGKCLWTVERAAKDGEEIHTSINLYLVEKHNGKWGRNWFNEKMHPYYYSCPVSFFELAPVANAEWREAVSKYQAGIKREYAIGQVIKLHNNEYRVTRTKPLCGVKSANGVEYRLPKTDMAFAEVMAGEQARLDAAVAA